MSIHVRSLFLAVIALSVAGAAEAGNRHRVEENCRGALAARGYPGFSLDNFQVQSTRNGWSMDGRMTKGDRRYQFSCVTDEQGYVRDVMVNRVGKSGSNNDDAAAAAVAAAAIIGVAALASHEKHHKGERPNDPNRLAEHDRGYRDGLYAAPYNDYRDSSDYRAGFDAGVEQRSQNIEHNQRHRWEDGRHGAPAELMMACANEADRYWRLPVGSTVPRNSRATGSGMYEVKLAAGWQRGTCTVDEYGSVKSIMND